jgi:hypothetical protein
MLDYPTPPNLDVLHLNDADASAQLLELHTPECLHHDVGELVLSAHELDVDIAIVDALTDEGEPGLDVLAPVVEDRVLCQRYR